MATFPSPSMSVIECTHAIWKEHIKPGSSAIDATCGNGQDALFIARHILQEDAGKLVLFDVQKDAIDKTRALLTTSLSTEQIKRVHYVCASHEAFAGLPHPFAASLIVYNLGYLPGGDKSLTTQVETTIQSLTKALTLLVSGGMISITCYPGHQEGKREETELLNMCKRLSKKDFTVIFTKWLNRCNAPSTITIKKNS